MTYSLRGGIEKQATRREFPDGTTAEPPQQKGLPMKELSVILRFDKGEKTVRVEVPKDWEYKSCEAQEVPSIETWAPQGETGVPPAARRS